MVRSTTYKSSFPLVIRLRQEECLQAGMALKTSQIEFPVYIVAIKSVALNINYVTILARARKLETTDKYDTIVEIEG